VWIQRILEKNMNVLVDSFGWIEYFGEGPLVNKYKPYIEKANPETHITPTIVIYEVYKRLKIKVSEEIALKAIAHILTYTKLVPLNDNLALGSAEKSIKYKLAMADSIVKTTAEYFGAQLITSDPDFKGLENVVLL